MLAVGKKKSSIDDKLSEKSKTLIEKRTSLKRKADRSLEDRVELTELNKSNYT